MNANATITNNTTCQHGVLGRVGRPDCGVLKRALTFAVIAMIVLLPLTGLLSVVDVGHAPRVETAHLDSHHTLYSLPHLPHTTDSLFDAWDKHPRSLFV